MENRTCRSDTPSSSLAVFGRNRKISYITCRDRRDGGGAQVCAQLSAILYAAHCGATYAHTPLEDIAHGPTHQSQEDWAMAWENFFSVGSGELQASDLVHLKKHELRKPLRRKPKGGRLNVVHHCHKFTNQHPEAWNALRPSIRKKYFRNEKPSTPLDGDTKLSIAIHIRRGDVGPSGSCSERFTASTTISSHLKRVTDLLGRDSCQIHLFSQKGQDLTEFDEFQQFDLIWHLDVDPFITFHSLASADILFSAKSCFSWLAGLINTGHVIQDDFWHPSMPEWTNFRDLPNLSDDELLTRLQSSPTNSHLSAIP